MKPDAYKRFAVLLPPEDVADIQRPCDPLREIQYARTLGECTPLPVSYSYKKGIVYNARSGRYCWGWIRR